MGMYKLLELKALIIRLILTFTSDKYVLNIATRTIFRNVIYYLLGYDTVIS